MNNAIRRKGSTEIAGHLRREIIAGNLAAKERLPPERVLANQYGVARGTVREALNRLADEGMVQIRAGSGSYVSFDPLGQVNAIVESTRPLELIDARFALEPHLCRLAVLHARQQELDALEALAETMESSIDDVVGFSQADMAFHTLLAESAGNSLLVWMMGQINSVRNQDEWARMRQLTLNRETIIAYNDQHRQILAAIRLREPERAANEMKEHLEGARLSLTRAAAT